MSKRGKYHPKLEDDDETVNDPTRYIPVDRFMNREKEELPVLPSTRRADTYGIRSSSGFELPSFAYVDYDD